MKTRQNPSSDIWPLLIAIVAGIGGIAWYQKRQWLRTPGPSGPTINPPGSPYGSTGGHDSSNGQ